MSLIEANRSLKTRESCPLGGGRIEKRRKKRARLYQENRGKGRHWGNFPSKLDWSMIKEVTAVNIMGFWEKGKDKGEGNKKDLRLKIIISVLL